MFNLLKRFSGSSKPKRQKSITRSILKAAEGGRLESSWRSTPVSIDSIISNDLSATVARSRDAALNDDYIGKFLLMCQTNVVGVNGVDFQSEVVNKEGGIDEGITAVIEDAYKDFSKKGNFDVTGCLSRAEFERLAISTVAEDGEFIAIIVRGDDAGEHGISLQCMDSVSLDPSHHESLSDNRFIRHGIEFNQYGRPIRYHFKDFVETSFGVINYANQGVKVVDAKDVIHLYKVNKPGQKRGIPWTKSSLWTLKMLKGFTEAALVAARVGSAQMGFLSDENADDYDEDDEIIDAEPGTIRDIGPKKFTKWDPQFPSGDFAPFVKSMLRSISSGLGVSYNNLANDLAEANFSSIRQGTLEEREKWKALQNWFIESLCERIFLEWLDVALLSNRIKIKGRPLKAQNRVALSKHRFQGTRWAWIDPLKDVRATTEEIQMKLKSRSEAIRERGRDPQAVAKQLDRDEELFGPLPSEETSEDDATNGREEN